jgi:Xaa-Pro dipeptidase
MHVPTIEELEGKYYVKFQRVENLYTDMNKRNPNKIYVLSGKNSDSGLFIHTANLQFPDTMKDWYKKVDNNQLIYEILADTRTRKTRHEKELLEYICKSTTDAHKEVMKRIKPDMLERDAENIFLNYMRNNNYSRIWAYGSICGCGSESAILHYDKNDKKLKDGDLLLIDCGSRIAGYCSDVTCTFPVNGKFTDRQKNIYNIVLEANREVIRKLKPGVYWPDMQKYAEEIIITGLAKLGLIKTEATIDELIQKRVPYYFMPHGLGHFIGLETHDVGGYLSFTPSRPTEIGWKSLRTSRYLNTDNVITVEPGIYFIPYLLNKAFEDPEIRAYLNEVEIQKYFDFGGIRIEDDILITLDGCINLSKDLPRTVEEIEEFMKKK